MILRFDPIKYIRFIKACNWIIFCKRFILFVLTVRTTYSTGNTKFSELANEIFDIVLDILLEIILSAILFVTLDASRVDTSQNFMRDLQIIPFQQYLEPMS